MIGHLGSRVTALLDGRLSAGEEERAWEHVHACHCCRDLVEREGWIKTQLAGYSLAAADAPSVFKARLLADSSCAGAAVGLEAFSTAPEPSRRGTYALIAGGAVGTAVVGVLALGMAPGSTPAPDRRLPTGSIGRASEAPTPASTPLRPMTGPRASHSPLVSVKIAG